jgi:uncharacterized membrane protein YphA (DoxX/SURF4 family)
MMSSSDRGVAVLRVGTGLSLLVLFGITKIKMAAAFTFAGRPWPFIDFNRSVGLPLPVAAAYIQSLNESVGAFLIAVGLFTRVTSVWLAASFAVAGACSLRAKEAGWPFTAGYLCLILIALAVSGSGRWSVDAWIRARRRDK